MGKLYDILRGTLADMFLKEETIQQIEARYKQPHEQRERTLSLPYKERSTPEEIVKKEIVKIYASIKRHATHLAQHDDPYSLEGVTRALVQDIRTLGNGHHGVISAYQCTEYLDRLEDPKLYQKGLQERKKVLEHIMGEIQMQCAISIGMQHMRGRKQRNIEEAEQLGLRYLEEQGL